MIHIEIKKYAPELENWKHVAANAKKSILETKNKKLIDFKPAIWMKLKKLLENCFYKKCAYCERVGNDGFVFTIDHYRPKSKVNEDKNHHGYYWLAYDLENILLACPTCNRSKGNHFPVKGLHAFSADGIGKEVPLLLNPYFDFPDEHLEFDLEGQVVGITDRGAKTIEICKLNRKELIDSRLKEWKRLKEVLMNNIFTSDKLSPIIADDQQYSAFLRYSLSEFIKEAVPMRLELRGKKIPIEDEPEKEGSNMYPINIKRLRLHNIKCFDDIEILFLDKDNNPRPWTLIVATNGIGKTTILQCIALCSIGIDFARILISRPQDLLKAGKNEGYMEAVFNAPYRNNRGKSEFNVKLVVKRNRRRFETVDDDMEHFTMIRNRSDFKGWFLAAYGSSRKLSSSGVPVRFGGDGFVVERINSLFKDDKILVDFSLLYSLIKGDCTQFKGMNGPAVLLPKIRSQVISIVEKILLGLKLSDLDDNNMVKTVFGPVPVSGLSDGYKSMLSWLVHFIVHLLLTVNWKGDINTIKGIVLLDEVDLHLHPAWQQKVIGLLKVVFPNIQFISTTHSPLTASGADDGELLLLSVEGNEIKVKQELKPIKGLNTDQILTNELFGLESTCNVEAKKIMKMNEELSNKDNPGDVERMGSDELKENLKKSVIPVGETKKIYVRSKPIIKKGSSFVNRDMEMILNNVPEKLVNPLKNKS